MKIIHIITDLDVGGAEMMLYKLLFSLHDDTSNHMVVSLMGKGKIIRKIEVLGVRVETLGLRQGALPGFRDVNKLRKIVKDFNPSVVQGWMYHGNIAATIAVFITRSLNKKIKLFWNIRQTLYEISGEKRQTRLLIILGRWLSFLPQGIIYNSMLSAKQHISMGFVDKNISIIPNGFDLKKFRPDQGRYKKFRKELGISEDVFLIGHISRLHTMKDHATLLKAIGRVTKKLIILMKFIKCYFY